MSQSFSLHQSKPNEPPEPEAFADIPVASDNPVHYADAIRYNARTPLQGSLLLDCPLNLQTTNIT